MDEENSGSNMLNKLSKITQLVIRQKNFNPNLFSLNPDLPPCVMLSPIAEENKNLSIQNQPQANGERPEKEYTHKLKGGMVLADKACMKCLIVEI